MKRMRRRMIGIALGLALGWMAQGMVQNFMTPAPALAASPADATSQDETIPMHDYAGAEHLRPSPRDASVYHTGIAAVVGLFVLVIAVGKSALNIAGRSMPTDAHDDEPADLHRHSTHH